MKGKPKLTFCLPVRNSEPYLAKTIRSITKQNLRDIEILIIDDNSQDYSWDIINYFQGKDKRIGSFRFEERKGAAYCRNEGNKIAKANIICVCDAGDVNHPNRARATYDFFKKHEVDIFASGVSVVNVLYQDLYQEFPRFTGRKGEKPSISHPTMAYRKGVTEKVQYWTTSKETDQYERFILEANDLGFKFGFSNNIYVRKIDFHQRDIKEAHGVKRKIYEDYGIPLPEFLNADI